MTPATDGSPRPLWFLGPGGIPVPASGKKSPKGVTHWCHETDAAWTPIEQSEASSFGPMAFPGMQAQRENRP